jgi:putative endonuclease
MSRLEFLVGQGVWEPVRVHNRRSLPARPRFRVFGSPGSGFALTLVAEVVSVPSTQQQRSSVGRYGEDVAVRHLGESGLQVLARNWRCDLGEIDVVARDGTTLVVCEVKTRSGLDYGTPLEAVTARKLARLRRLAARWLAESGEHPQAVRIDVVSVLLRRRGAALVEHLRGVA